MKGVLSLSCSTPRFDHCGLFRVPEAEVLTKRSPISDGRGDRRKFDTGPSRRPAKRVPEMGGEREKKRWERCINSGGECFEGDKFDFVVSKKRIN